MRREEIDSLRPGDVILELATASLYMFLLVESVESADMMRFVTMRVFLALDGDSTSAPRSWTGMLDRQLESDNFVLAYVSERGEPCSLEDAT